MTTTTAGPVLFARGRTRRPQVPRRVLGIDPGGAWTGLCLTDPGHTIVQALTVSRYAVPGYAPARDFHARNAKHWQALANSGHSRHLDYDQAYVERLAATLTRLLDAYGPFDVVVEGMNPAAMFLRPNAFKAEIARQTCIAYTTVLALVPGACVVEPGDKRGQWGEPRHGGAGTTRHYPPPLLGGQPPAFWATDTERVKEAATGWPGTWTVPHPHDHPREAFDHITHALMTGRIR